MINIYADLISQPARAVVALCNMAKIQHTVINLRIFKGETKTEEYKEIHPEQKVPAMVDGKYSLFESHAIMRYLCNSRTVADHFYPKTDFKKRATIDAYLDWHHQNTRQHCIALLLQTNMPYLIQHKQDVNVLNKNLDRVLDFFQKFWLKDGKFIGGMDQVSIADLSAYCEIYQLNLMEYDFSKWTILLEWMNRMSQFTEIKEINKTPDLVRELRNKNKQKL